ncbi:MAG: succinylglutamate desuccinylase/aspartoacylase family protein [Sulfitobacter sp.]|uniref:succinylglutamate desuccinylase/aspartoacylase family protein n=1 Tax=Ascidiaceihabitans sp. TaxID=1872644 RepID=UPI003297180F
MMDFDASGLSSGYLEFHNSTNVSAWQMLRVPVYCINGAPGPTTLVLGGMHGDEYEGPIAIQHLVQGTSPDDLVGRLILVPALNLPAVQSGTRLSPEDGLNLNRVFPGDPQGSLTQRIAHFISETLIPLADHVIDLHSGGRSLNFAPSVLLHEVEGPAMQKALNAAKAFDAPFTVLLNEDHADVMIDAIVERAGKVMIATELGGSGILTPTTAQIAKDGLKNCLTNLGHFDDLNQPEGTSCFVRFPESDTYLISDDTLLFEPLVELGRHVSKGDVIGLGHMVDRIDVAPVLFKAPQKGWFVCTAGQGLVHRGDVVAIVAREVE